MSKSQPTTATIHLRNNMDNFMAEFREEFARQDHIANAASDRRMRKLLRTFRERVYVPYRRESLDHDEGKEHTPPF